VLIRYEECHQLAWNSGFATLANIHTIVFTY
jgi:hypothetical protein